MSSQGTTNRVEERVDGADRSAGRQRRARAMAAALAAGGLTSLAVVLLGAPAAPTGHAEQVVAATSVTTSAPPARRADVTLGETS